MSTRFAAFYFLLAVFASSEWCSAQTSNDQTFNVRVPGVISIIAENSNASMPHDLSERDQRFPWQVWTVRNQSAQGAIVTLETNQAFTNTLVPTSKRDVHLQLRRRRSPGWRITKRTDQTNYGATIETASVSAESDRAGGADLRLRVTFLEESVDTLSPGVYEIVITGTLSPK